MNVSKHKLIIPQPLYELSTQFKNWRFSESGLKKARQELNEGAVNRVKLKLQEERKTQGLSIDQDLESNQIEYLTVQDELELVTFYLTKISQLCRASIFKFPETVESTAMTYLKRFYLSNTCMDYHPKNIMLTCLFLATKTENNCISIDSFASRIPKTSNEDVLELEFMVAQSLKFQFKVHHAHLAARGIYLDLQVLKPNPISIERLIIAWPEVCELLRTARLTDAEFLWTPSQIATAAWWISDEIATREWLTFKFNLINNQQKHQINMFEGLNQLIENIIHLTKLLIESKNKPINKDKVIAVDRRLKFCKNPEKDPNSNLYKIKKAELETSHATKQQEKYSKILNQDPFS